MEAAELNKEIVKFFMIVLGFGSRQSKLYSTYFVTELLTSFYIQ